MKQTQKMMFLGTGSDVGKSICTTAFCRILKNRGVRVAPFKAQNMSNNSFVTVEGGEIGRAQVAQAESCGLTPTAHMNPVLLKPSGDMGSQVVLCGKVYANMKAAEYYAFKDTIKEKVMESYRILENEFEAIVMEGAGSCAEVNLRKHDIVNFEMALMVDAPVIIVADIDKGGVFAQIIGSLEIIPPEEKDRVAGFLINKFRGDPALFDTGIDYIEQKTGKPVFGLVPWFTDFKIDSEDSMSLDNQILGRRVEPEADKINFAIVRIPHISNFTDLEVLETEPDVTITWMATPRNIDRYDVVVIPGSKSTIADMIWMQGKGWDRALYDFVVNRSGVLVGLCGGFQILGKEIRDPMAIEGLDPTIKGLGMIDAVTRIEPAKVVKRSIGKDHVFGSAVEGYEIHMGQTRLAGNSIPFLELDTGPDGAVNADRTVMGTYLHGLFDAADFRTHFLNDIAQRKGISIRPAERENYWEVKQKNYDRLADHFTRYADIDAMIRRMK